MEDKLFDTPEKQEKAIIAFTELNQHPGWILFTQILDANIEYTQSRLNDTSIEHTKEMDDAWREHLNIYKKMKNTPMDRVEDFKRPRTGNDPMKELDPYDNLPGRN